MLKIKSLFVASATAFFLFVSHPVRAELPDFTKLVEMAAPAVVNISTRQKVDARMAEMEMMPFMGPDMDGLPPIFQEFFERSVPRVPRGQGSPRGQQREAQSLGSGFIISQDGYILTNNHVVADADEIIVRLSDRSELEAKLIGTDPRTDVALLKVEAKDLPTVKVGKSNDIKVGEWVLAIGSPFGFDHSVTKGIVSAKGRSLPNENYVPFIQTDVAINPGNSGGPLFNLQGEVVGINSQIFTRSGGFMGLSFAIPMEVAMDVANQLKETGSVDRGWLGVVIQEVNKDLAESFGLDKPSGALVVQIVEDGPAANSSLRVGDVILELNDHPIVMSADLPHLVGALKSGMTAKMLVMRDGKKQTISVKVGAMPSDGKVTVGKGKSARSMDNRLGISIVDLTADQKKQAGIKKGVVISQVSNGPAAMMGLRAGDIITHLNNQLIESAEQFSKIAKDLPPKRSISMRVLRDGQASFLTFKLN